MGRFFISAGCAAENRGGRAARITSLCRRVAAPRRVWATATGATVCGGRSRPDAVALPCAGFVKSGGRGGELAGRRGAALPGVARPTSKRAAAASAPCRRVPLLQQGSSLLAKTAGHGVGAVPWGSLFAFAAATLDECLGEGARQEGVVGGRPEEGWWLAAVNRKKGRRRRRGRGGHGRRDRLERARRHTPLAGPVMDWCGGGRPTGVGRLVADRSLDRRLWRRGDGASSEVGCSRSAGVCCGNCKYSYGTYILIHDSSTGKRRLGTNRAGRSWGWPAPPVRKPTRSCPSCKCLVAALRRTCLVVSRWT